MASEWRIYYANGAVVRGLSPERWRSVPSEGVQAVVLMRPVETPRWYCNGRVIKDRELWTGEDEYDPFKWGVKHGSLIPDEDYFAIWERACGDS